MTDVRPWLEELFPIESDFFRLEWVPDSDYRPPHAAPDDLYVLVRLVCWYLNGAEMHIRDVKEQPVLLVSAGRRQDPRIEAYLRGWSAALTTVMESQDLSVGRDDTEAMYADNALACLMPMDLVHADALELTRPQTAEDFSRALLDSRKRLGRFVFPPPKP
ncbi:hypothetical protein [Hyalangium gracile]|uniref:hypothetical protein n=1 Tax=Hyalangium gracile TaxID=394092 RepID=UPI001CCBFD47|nr:hypothetical protein [Hyalangium gracile]